VTQVSHTPSDLQGRAQFVPGYPTMLQMSAQLLAEAFGERGSVLVLGAGGGLELEAFATRWPDWRYCAVDPDTTMLQTARERVQACGALDRVAWVEGTIFEAPQHKHDGATCLLTLHFVADDGEKLRTLQGMHDRLRPGGPLVLVDLCADKGAVDYQRRLDRYQRFALESGAPAAQAASTTERVRTVIHSVSAARNEALLHQAGFTGVDLFYAGLSWRGWVAYA
jgi:tRNA (cmo5U34)-methyltransferase